MTASIATTETATVTSIIKPTCRKCGRVLRNLDSIVAGIGPKCAARERREAKAHAAQVKAQVEAIIETFGATRVAKALQAIEDGAVVPSSRPRLFFAVSSDGSVTYLVNTIDGSCTCPAGQRDVLCYHLAAATIKIAAHL